MINPLSDVKAVVHLDNIRKNLEIIKSRVGKNTKITAVVKSDAYGHGAVEVSRTALESGATMLAVATVSEGVNLREAGIDAPILVLSRGGKYDTAVRYDLTEAVYCTDEAKAISEIAVKYNKTAEIHIKLNTGMSRLGFDAFEGNTVEDVYQISLLPNIKISGIFSHFATSDMEDEKDFVKVQLDRFNNAVADLENRGIHIENKHICNSGGIFNYPEAHLDSVRAGIALYGCAPDDSGVDYGLCPVMEFKATVIDVRTLRPGESVSYGRHFKTETERKIAVIGAGYADGYTRRLSSKSCVLIKGKRAPIAGNICMDVFMADVTDIEDVRTGDEVTLIGKDGAEEITAGELGNLSGTISYEILCSVSKRVPREYIG